MKQDRETERKIQMIVRLCHAGLDSHTLMVETIKRLGALLPIDASFFATVDPATLLFTGSVADDILVRATPQFLVNEFFQDDVNTFRSLAREVHPVGYLDAATEHQLERSPRYRDILAPLALGGANCGRSCASMVHVGACSACIANARLCRLPRPRRTCSVN